MSSITTTDLLVIGLAVVGLGAVVLGPRMSAPGTTPFNAEAWREDGGGCKFLVSSVRPGMSTDLARMLTGAPRPARNEVERLLGTPDVSRSDRLWSYSAGTSTMDCLTFDVEFAADGSVAAAGLVQH